MWSTGIFMSEMCGTFILVFMSLFIVLASKSAIIKLHSSSQRFFNAIGIGLALTLAILVAFGVAKASGAPSLGYVNPVSVMLAAIARNNYNYFLPAMTGQLIGAIMAGGLVLASFLALYSKNPLALIDAKATFALPSKKERALKTILGETFAAFIFYGVIMAVSFSGKSFTLIGLSLTLIFLTFGLRFRLTINVFASIIPMLLGIVITRPSKKALLNGLKNVGVSSLTNASVAAIMGGIYFAFSQ